MLPEQVNIHCNPVSPLKQCLLTGSLWTAADRIVRGYNMRVCVCVCVCVCVRVRGRERVCGTKPGAFMRTIS
jgi:hypothetical protein